MVIVFSLGSSWLRKFIRRKPKQGNDRRISDCCYKPSLERPRPQVGFSDQFSDDITRFELLYRGAEGYHGVPVDRDRYFPFIPSQGRPKDLGRSKYPYLDVNGFASRKQRNASIDSTCRGRILKHNYSYGSLYYPASQRSKFWIKLLFGWIVFGRNSNGHFRQRSTGNIASLLQLHL